MSFTALACSLDAAKETIMERWLEAVRRACLPSAQDLAEPRLRDHVPDLLTRVVEAIAGSKTPGVEAEGQEHGHQRFGTGYDITEVVRELGLLRDVLLEQVEELACGSPGLTRQQEREVRVRILAVLDRSVQSSVAQFHADAMAVRRMLWSELEATNLQLKATNEQKDRFLAMLSHELRNPLAPILTAVQLLEFGELADPRLKRARDVIERQVRHQARLIDDLLDVSRITSGKLALRLEPHNLKAAIAYAVERCLPGMDAKNQQLRVELPDEPLPVEADLVRLEQILTNLLTNANRYTEPGGTIWLTAARVDGEALVQVRDTGIGIAPAQLTRVFDLFTRGETAAVHHQGGLGLGLALVKHLVELHSGTVEAQSAGLGKGSEFVVRLPLVVAAPVTALEQRLGATVKAFAMRRIVLVEDNADARAVLSDLLELLGHQVLPTPDAETALRLARAAPPDVYVIDIGLPGIDGYELARRLRQVPGNERVLLIAITGYGAIEEKEQAQAAGFDAHLTKPADLEELQRLLARAF
jgi:signal transduction histidine kinase/CheY-like chemotaxis protein